MQQAFQRFELENQISTQDQIYFYDDNHQKQQLQEAPWKQDPNYFKHVCVSSVALIKMVMHCKSGGSLEVMGLMQGKIMGDTIYIMDAFALPVQGTETRVNAQEEAYEYMSQYLETIKKVCRPENAIGWYHSHPGYGCWLSGIDVCTQQLYQTFQDPFVAVVIDPNRTISAGKVEIGAFRTYPENHQAQTKVQYQSIPLDKIEDFGVYMNKYYALQVSYFKSTLDQSLLESLWKQYWMQTLASNPLLSNREFNVNQLKDLSFKVEKLQKSTEFKSGLYGDEEETPMTQLVQDSVKLTSNLQHAMMSQVIKYLLFNKE